MRVTELAFCSDTYNQYNSLVFILSTPQYYDRIIEIPILECVYFQQVLLCRPLKGNHILFKCYERTPK